MSCYMKMNTDGKNVRYLDGKESDMKITGVNRDTDDGGQHHIIPQSNL